MIELIIMLYLMIYKYITKPLFLKEVYTLIR